MINSPETERYCLASILRYPELLADIQAFIRESDFSSGKLNRTIFGAMISSQGKSEDINPFQLATRIKNAGIYFEELEGGDAVDYLEGLKMIQINERSAPDFFKELKRTSVRREIWEVGAALQKEMTAAKDANIDEIITLADKVYGQKISSFEGALTKDFSNIYENLEEIIEERGENPVTEFGLMGPFTRVNEIYGSLLKPGNITLIGARQNVGKSSLGHYYLTYVADKHQVPHLHLDAGEMSEFELQLRTVTMLTEGEVPINMLEEGTWRQNPVTEKLVRHAWNRVRIMKKIGCFYKNIGGLTPDEILSAIRRFYWSKVGREKEFVIHYDYLKSFDSFGTNSPEWQQMGYFIQKLKTLITNEVPVGVWTSLQLNRTGIVGNKAADQIDNTENTFSVSDRIIQQASHAFLLRKKTNEELAMEPNLGNAKMFNVKKRHLGKDFQAAINPVRMPDDSLRDNYLFMETKSFVFREVGDLLTLKDKVGVANLTDDDNHHRPTRNDEDVDI